MHDLWRIVLRPMHVTGTGGLAQQVLDALSAIWRPAGSTPPSQEPEQPLPTLTQITLQPELEPLRCVLGRSSEQYLQLSL